MGCGTSTQIVQNIDLGKLTTESKKEDTRKKNADNKSFGSVDNTDEQKLKTKEQNTLDITEEKNETLNFREEESKEITIKEEKKETENVTIEKSEIGNSMDEKNDSQELTVEKWIEEVRRIYSGIKACDSLIKSGQDLFKYIREDSVVGNNVLKMLGKTLSLATLLAPSIRVVQGTVTILTLYTAFRKISTAWSSHEQAIDQDRTYSELEKIEEMKFVVKAKGFEKALFHNMAFFSTIDEKTHENIIHTLENKLPTNDIVMILISLHLKIETQIGKTEQKSVDRAIIYIDLYCKLASLRQALLWQVYYIKAKCGDDKSSKDGILALIEESQKNDKEMIRAITKITIEHAMFLSVFHPTENKNRLNFLRIHEEECEIARLYKNKHFIDREHVISCPKLSGMRLKMPDKTEDYIKGDEKLTKGNFNFEPVEKRDWDNIFYLKSAHSKLYVYMKKDKYCYSQQDKPGLNGQWKLVRFETGQGPPRFIISTLERPVRFLYLYKGWKMGWWLAGTENIKEAIEKGHGLWEISNA